MRKIKFRAWNKYRKCWIYPLSFTDNTDGILSIANMDIGAFILMQYTGRKDVNDDEIYEGDIVEVNERIGCIEWVEELARWQIFFKGDNVGDALGEYWQHMKPKKIGNVYQNAELLSDTLTITADGSVKYKR